MPVICRLLPVVDEHHLVALAPPIALVLQNTEGDPDIVPRALSLKHDVVVMAVFLSDIVHLRVAV